MPLRKSLEPDEPKPELVERLKRLAIEIEEGLNAHHDMATKIREFSSLSGYSPDPREFQTYYGAVSLDDFVKSACVVQCKPVPDITREELIEIVRRICEAEGEEWEESYYMALLEANVPDPEVSDLIFYSDDDPTPEEIVDRALSYRAQPMPPHRP